jgi:uncharacterized protein (DUF983 family)
MTKCPNCQHSISIFQILKHSKFSPTICRQCGAKLSFNNMNWYGITAPLLIIIILKIITTEILNYEQPWIFLVFIILMIGAAINFFVGLNNIKMKIKDK